MSIFRGENVSFREGTFLSSGGLVPKVPKVGVILKNDQFFSGSDGSLI